MSERLLQNPSHLQPYTEGSQKLLQILTTDSTRSREYSQFVTPLSKMVIGNEGRFAYSSHLINPYDREHWWIPMDHCYARPWNWRPDSTFLRPTKTLFMPKTVVSKKRIVNTLASDFEDTIDVENVSQEPSFSYDRSKAKAFMEECQIHAQIAKSDEAKVNWEENISKTLWTTTQSRLFNGMVNILNSDHLSRLANADTHNEPVARRVAIDKAVERVRRLMATVCWDVKYTQWINQLLIDNLNSDLLASYLDILQSLRAKLPTFVDKMMTGTSLNRNPLLTYENLFPLLKRPWDPIASTLAQDKPKKLPGSPVIVVVPSTPISSKRMLKWITSLSNLATVITIPSNYGGSAHKTVMMNCVDQMFVMTRNKIQDIRVDYPGRNIILAGFGFGATLALQIAHVEQVLCVISIGFSLLTADGKRGEADDNLLELQCPILFVIGQCSTTSIQEDMEDLRERMRVETGLIIVGSADDNLRISKKKKKSEGITQSVVDRYVIDEIGEFISGIILSPYPPQIRQSPTNLTTDATMIPKKMKTERKRYNSNTSSVESEPPSPTPRIPRPGQNSSPSLGRPPGTKARLKLESKWARQGITTSSPSNSPPHSSTLHTPDTSSNDSNMTLTYPETVPPLVKKIKTLKPTIPASPDKNSTASTSPSSQTVKAMGMQNRVMMGDYQNYVQQPQMLKSNSSGIRVLENVKLNNPVGGSKVFSNNGKMIDMSNLSVTKSTNGNSLVLLPDGKIKNMKMPGPNRYITSKKQLMGMGNRPAKPMKKLSYLPKHSLPPPTNLTTQDIMDLPIIFADDNQIIDNTTMPQLVVSSPTQKMLPNGANKFMVINKPQNYVITPNTKPTPTKQQPKYTKIILSKKVPELANITTNVVKRLSSEVVLKRVTPNSTESPDLEDEIVANTLYKGDTGDLMDENSSKRSSDAIDNMDVDEPPNKILKIDTDLL